MNYHQTASHIGIELEPTTPTKHTIIWLHGLGADGNDFVPIASELRLPETLAVRFVFPHAPIMPITINGGYEMRAWYDIYYSSLEKHYDEDGIATSRIIINELLSKEEARGITSENMMLAGFSQGAAMSLSTGLQYKNQLGGIIALSGYLPMATETLKEATTTNKSTPIFMAHGTQDTIVPLTLGENTKDQLIEAGYPVTWRDYPMPHTVSIEEIHAISAWIQTIWK
jgi:phospholipase/carboxylesterase